MDLHTIPSRDELRQLDHVTNAHEAHYSPNYIRAVRTAYARQHELMQELLVAEHEGVLEIIVRTRTTSIVLPVNEKTAGLILQAVNEQHAQELRKLQGFILSQLCELEHEQDDLDGTSDRARAFALCMPSAPAPTLTPPNAPHLRAVRPHRDAEAA